MDDNRNILLGSEPSSEEVNKGIKRLKEWLRSKNVKHFLKTKKSGFSVVGGVCLSIGASAISVLALGGIPLALSIATWGGQQLASRMIFMDLWNETQKRIKKKTGKNTISDKETAEYIMKLDGAQIHALATDVCDTFKNDPEIKLFLTDIVRNALASDEFKEIIGKILVEEIKKDMEIQHKEILEEVRKCGIRSFYEILLESQKVDFKNVYEKFRRTIRLCPEELVCVITNGGTIERTLENDVIRNLDNGKNVLTLGISGSGKTVFLIRVCYRLHLAGWKVFFTDECIDSQKSRELFARTEGKKVLVVDNAAKHDEYFDLINNLRSDIRIIMAEQDIIWANKNRSIKGYNFNELKLTLSDKEVIEYIDKFGGNKRLLKIINNVFPILTFLVTEGKESIEKLTDTIWKGLNTDEKRVAYPIFVLSSFYLDYPRSLFNEIYDSPHILDELRNKNIIDVRESSISTIHPLLSQIIVNQSIKERFDEIELLIKKIKEKNPDEKKEYFDFLFTLGYNLSVIGSITKNKKFYFYGINSFDICISINSENYKIWLNKGAALIKMGEHQKAIECLDKALVINPKELRAWINKGAALIGMGEHKKAIECFDKALEIDPNEEGAWINKGAALMRMGEHKKAIECYDNALEIEPKEVDAWINKGATLSEMGEHQKAIECFDNALKIDPRYIDAWFNKGVILGKMGEHQKAIECYDNALEIYPGYYDAWINMGRALFETGEYEKAIECFDNALVINPKESHAWVNKGTTLFKIGEYQKAIECFDNAIEIDPKEVDAWLNKGRALFETGEHEKAIECYDNALKIDPRYIDAWINKGATLSEMGEYQKAIECYDNAMEINPKYFIVWLNKGESLFEIGEHQKAIECFDKALEIDPKAVDAWVNKGAALIGMSERKKAIECFDKALEIDPKAVDVWLNKGAILTEMGERKKAIECFDKALEIDPKDVDAWNNKIINYSKKKTNKKL